MSAEQAQSGDRGQLPTEQSLPAARNLDALDTRAALELFAREDSGIIAAIRSAHPDIERALDLVVERLARGGRLFYVGAGTSGRLGVLDATECPPTFQSDPEQVQAILAGGTAAITRSVEGAEDDSALARADLEQRNLSAADVVFGITAGGTTPYVHAAIAAAHELGAGTIFFACVPANAAPDRADVSIRVVTGPEILTGSTRLKAGTATKLVLNMLSTLAMARLGKVYGNLMVDVNARANVKLIDRAERIVMEGAGASRAEARTALEQAAGQAKLAILMLRAGIDSDAAAAALAEANGHLRAALAALSCPPTSAS